VFIAAGGAMKARRFKCRHCGRVVTDGKTGQKYCGDKECRAARKGDWRRKKYASDAEYRIGQKESTEAWLEKQGGAAAYYREYRVRKRLEKAKQKAIAAFESIRTSEPTSMAKVEAEIAGGERSLFAPLGSVVGASANRDACLRFPFIKAGIYELLPQSANRDSITVEIRMISGG
jgi:hypothetical protein